MSLAEEEALEVFNTLQLASSSEKPKLLKSLTEIVIRREPGLLDRFLEQVLELQVDKAVGVRKAVLDFYDEALGVVVTVHGLLLGAQCVIFLLEDQNAGVKKRSIRSLISVFHLTLCLAAKGEDTGDEGARLWKIVQEAVKKVEEMAVDENGNTGCKLSASKFLEQSLLFVTGDRVPACAPVLLQPAALPAKGSVVTKQAAMKIGTSMLSTVIKMLKEIKSTGNDGPLAISCIRSVSTILESRPQFAGKMVPVLLSFCQLDSYKDSNEDNKAASALEESLRAFGKSKSQLAAPWKKKINEALVKLGKEPLLDQEVNPLKRSRDDEAPMPMTRMKSDHMSSSVQKYEGTIKDLLMIYDAEGLFRYIQNIPAEDLANLVLRPLKQIKAPKVSTYADLITDRICNLMIGDLRNSKLSAKEPELALVAKDFKDPLEPITLENEQVSHQRLQALKRILSGSKGGNTAMQTRLVARLATLYPNSDNAFEAVVSSIMQDYTGRKGHETFCLLLVTLFIELMGDGNEEAEELISGSRYETALQCIIDRMHQFLPPTDKALPNLLLEIPIIPSEVIVPFLQDLIREGNGWDNLGLVIARDVILNRPKCRKELLDVVLQLCSSEDNDLRIKTIRMCTNQLFIEDVLESRIETVAKEHLHTPPRNGNPEQEKLDADRFTALYCALCTKKSKLIRELFSTFGGSGNAVQEAIMDKCPRVAESVGQNDENLLSVIKNPPEGSKVLVIRVIESLSVSLPSRSFVESVLEFFDKVHDPSSLVPVLPSLQKQEAIKLLPALIQLPESTLSEAIKNLCTPIYPEQSSPVMTAAEILTILHMVDDKKALKHAMTAISMCLGMREYFTSEVLAASLSQLITRIPLPQLFMRTVLQSLSVAPKLRSFIVSILDQLTSKQIWTNTMQWKGWVMASQQTSPESFPIILRLPPNVLNQALNGLQPETKKALADFALSSNTSTDLSENAIKILKKYQT